MQAELPSGRFRYEPGSYGGPGRGYMPSILCYKLLGSKSWKEHFCLVNPAAVLEVEDAATAMAEEHLAAAHTRQTDGGSIQDFAIFLRHAGYKNVSDFRVVKDDDHEELSNQRLKSD